MLIKYIKSVLWRVAKCLSYIEEARCLKVNKKNLAKNTVLLCYKQELVNIVQIYRAIQEESSIFWEVIQSVIVREKVPTNMCIILNGYREWDVTFIWPCIIDINNIDNQLDATITAY